VWLNVLCVMYSAYGWVVALAEFQFIGGSRLALKLDFHIWRAGSRLGVPCKTF